MADGFTALGESSDNLEKRTDNTKSLVGGGRVSRVPRGRTKVQHLLRARKEETQRLQPP